MLVAPYTKMPRNLRTFQAAAILYGDWGTSKAYVIGIAFALAGFSAFWLLVFVGLLNIIVGLNYILICKLFPEGGGVYASVRNRSKILALAGALFLTADYIVTASLSSLSAFYYFGVIHPALWAGGAILAIGAFNYLGPRSSSLAAAFIAAVTVILMVILASLSLPFLPGAITHLEPLKGGFLTTWNQFVGVVVALSGIETIANITRLMTLDADCTEDKPKVTGVSKPAILWVMFEVVFLTTILGLAVNALPGLIFKDGNVFSPDGEPIRDFILRYMGKEFSTELFGESTGFVFGALLSIVVGTLLLSAVNTAIVSLQTLLYVVSKDKELPSFFHFLNRFGVPQYSLLVSAAVPAVLVCLIGDVASLADLYAVGFVGAIATNLGSTCSNFELPISKKQRAFMFAVFLLMVAIEITLFIDKPHARNFAIGVMLIGLLLRGLVLEREVRRKPAIPLFKEPHPLPKGASLCAIIEKGKGLDYALQEGILNGWPLHVLFIREQRAITDIDLENEWWEDPEACLVVDHLTPHVDKIRIKFYYMKSDRSHITIAESARDLQVSRIILDAPRRSRFLQIIQGNLIKNVARSLPNSIDLVIIS